jgi:molybdopterin guanine dinucleotide-containing S/N-oxide reductase-like protein
METYRKERKAMKHISDEHEVPPVPEETEKTFIKALGLCAHAMASSPSAVDVKNGKIVRIRPLHYDWKYTREEIKPWNIERNGKTFEPSMKALPSPYMLAYKKRVYSPNRVKYPLKRVDWDPKRERNPQNRGISKFKRISWDEATDIIATEIRRIQEKYGPYAILLQGDGHGETKTVHGPHGCSMLLLREMGGYTLQVRNQDSWEGWAWGAMHVWGTGEVGLMRPPHNLFKDISENTEMALFWGFDPETTPWGFSGQFPSQACYWWSKVGIKQIYICPELNYGAAVHADKWIPVLPNTDAALQLAIIYTWMTEGTYDKDYVVTHTVGFGKVEDYVLGREDGIPKSPAWASPKCGVPEWTIKALAREFASKTTSIVHYYGGGLIRGPYSHEPARLEVILLGMQGLGKPGVHQYNIFDGLPRNVAKTWANSLSPVWTGRLFMTHPKQIIPKTLIQEAILNPPVTSWGSTSIFSPVEDQFVKYTYPIPKEEGGAEIHMMWTDTPCRTTCWNCGNKTIEALRSPKIEFVLAQHPWLENDSLFSDIILPVSTKLEEEDIASSCFSVPLDSIVLEGQCIEPIGESKSDYEIVGEIAKKLGKYEEYTRGKSIKEWIKVGYDVLFGKQNIELDFKTLSGELEAKTKSEFKFASEKQNLISWEEFNEKGYYVIPTDPKWKEYSPGLRKFYENPEKYPLPTPSGKLEFYSKRLAEHFPDDEERPPIPKWIEKGVTHDERLFGERAKKYPLLIMSNHGRWRVHAQCDDIDWTREAPTCKVKGWDGYMYEPLWINPKDAEKRGIKNGDIVKVYNERGTVLGGAIVWERIRPDVVYMDHGARVDSIIPGKIDRGGAINLISPANIISKNCAGQATSGYLVEVEKLGPSEMEEWRKIYPEAFEREYDPASGLRFNAWVDGGMS